MLGDELFFPGDDELAEQENELTQHKHNQDNSSDQSVDSNDEPDSTPAHDAAQRKSIPTLLADMSLDDDTDSHLSQSDDRSDRGQSVNKTNSQPIAIPPGQMHFRALGQRSDKPLSSRLAPDGTLSCTYTPDYKRDELMSQRPPSRNTVSVVRAQTQPMGGGQQRPRDFRQKTLQRSSKSSVK